MGMIVVFIVVLLMIVVAAYRVSKEGTRPVRQETTSASTRKRGNDARAPAIGPLPPLAHPLEPVAITVQPVPPDAEVVVVRSETRPGVRYSCDLHAIECTCPDFSERRRHFPPTDPTRLCKHLRRSALERGILTVDDPTALRLLRESFGGPMCRAMVNGGDTVYFAYAVDSEWVDVFVEKRKSGEALGNHSGPYERFGWSIEGHRWSYGEGPDGAREIRAILKHVEEWRRRAIAASPSGLLEAIAAAQEESDRRRAAEAEQSRIEEEARGTPCYVCEAALPVANDPPARSLVVCSVCGIRNVITQNGRANRPERLAIYHKYDGDPYDRTAPSLVGEMEARFATEHEELRQQRKNGAIDDRQYKSLYGKLSRRRDAARLELALQKQQELEPLQHQEEAIRKSVTTR